MSREHNSHERINRAGALCPGEPESTLSTHTPTDRVRHLCVYQRIVNGELALLNHLGGILTGVYHHSRREDVIRKPAALSVPRSFGRKAADPVNRNGNDGLFKCEVMDGGEDVLIRYG